VSGRGLTDAQRRVARIVLTVAEPEGFHLAGGAALVASNMTDRPTRAINVVTPDDVDVGAVADRVAAALQEAGFEVEETRRFAGRVTLMVTAVGPRRSTFAVDLARDPMTWAGASTSLGPALSPRELAANKVLALFDRVQTRDLADLAALAEQLPLEDMLADAEAKEPAFSRRLLAEWVRKVIASPQADWPEGADVKALRRFGAELAESLEQGPG
jgi:Nucleotidyl transferase AbiEii toxin, Type IV TA system